MGRRSTVVLGAAITLLAAACGGEPEALPYDAAGHEADVTRFADARVAEIAAPDSWLSLIALHWVGPEGTTLGSDPSNDLVLPEGKAAPFLGRVFVEGDSILRFVAEDGVRVTEGVDSTLSLPAGSGAFPPDVSGDPVVTDVHLGSAGPGKSRVLRHGDINWIQVRRGERFALRVRDNTTGAYDDFTGIERFPIGADWRVTAEWVPHEKTVAVPNVLGTVAEVNSPAHVAFWVDGERHTLDVTGDPDADRFMLVFADATSGRGTYGGGRYVWIGRPDTEGRVALDFNLAYNPPCVWSAFATCPLPSRDNRLAVSVEAGERDWVH